jgi:hypothetical protein
MTTLDRDWITEGAEAAVRSGGFTSHIEFVRIERLTATLIVLADGRRFARRNLAEQVKHPACSLVDPKDPQVVDAFARQQLRTFARGADRLVSGSGATVQNMDAAEVRAALADLVDKLNAARKEVDRRAGL